jgi:hypothetical protein
MRQPTRLIFAALTGVWLVWACGSSSKGGFSGAAAAAGEGAGGEGSSVGGDTGSGATNNTGATSQTGGSDGTEAGASNTNPGAGNGNVGEGGVGGNLCSGVGAVCVQSAECCSENCDPETNRCLTSAMCRAAGGDCEQPTDCCTLQCGADGKCSADACVSDDQACETNEECCSGVCLDGACGALNPSCKTAGNACQSGEDCCSKTCGENGTCTLGVSYCIQPGDVCARDNDCCTGDCTVPEGATLGLCADPPAGSAFCKGVDGVLCSDCGDCCSRLCAPFGPTGAKICQPANGCRVTGDLCRRDEDCCGGTDDETLPGYGNVICEKEAGKEIGLCRNPSNGDSPGGACNPQGNVCHYKNYECNISSARANCCGGLGAKGGVCQLDPLGIPRCNGLGDECRLEGETCASTDDCCDERPCVPDAQGNLRCGGDQCQRSGDTCTVNADCCPGSTCVRAPGALTGTCGGGDDPPGGVGGAPSTGEGGNGNTPGCSEYGQLCDGAADCCNSVPCTNGLCRYPAG